MASDNGMSLPPQAPEMGEFDGATFLADNGLTLLGAGKREGEVLVADQRGNETTLNMRQIMGEAGLNPGEYNVVLNSPDSALNTSPVGFGDRIRLAIGNAKGQINYLKANYQDAALRDGELYVKDKGVWHTVDARGLGDGNGWDVAAELAGDVVDFAREGALAAGQIAGAAVGTVGATPGVGTVVGAAAGSGIASAGMAALGRIVGTYDASPEEVAKDIGLDFLLGAAGEGVALGAKTAILPGIGRAIEKLGKAELPMPVRNMLSSVLSQTSGVSERSVNAALDGAQSSRIATKLAQYADEASQPVSLGAGSNPFDDVAVQSFAPGSQEAIDAIARKDMVTTIRRMAGAKAGDKTAPNLQRHLSNQYESIIGEVADAVPAEQYLPIKQELGTHWSELVQSYQKAGILEDGSQTKLRSVADIADYMGISKQQAAGLKEASETYLRSLENRTLGEMSEKGPEAMREVFKQIKASNDLYAEHIKDSPIMKEIFDGAFGRLQNSLRSTANFDVSVRGKAFNGSQAISHAQNWYGKNKDAMTVLKKAVEGGTAGIESLAGKFLRPTSKEIASKQALEQVASFMPGGAEHLSSLNVATAAAEFAKVMPRGAIGASVPRATLAVGGGALLGPMGAAAGIAVSSPKALFKSITAAQRGLNATGSMLRKMPESTRRSILLDPEKMAALLGAGIGGVYDPTAQ